jgi:hypothetical protein
MKKKLLAAGLVLSAATVAGGAWAGDMYLITPTTGTGTLQGGQLVNLRPDCTDSGTVNLSLFLTHNWNPNGQGGTYFNHSLAHIPYPCAVAAADGSPITPGVQVNAYWMGDTPNVVWRHTATSANIARNWTLLSGAAIELNPSAVIQISQRGQSDPHNLGVWYTGSKWAVFNQDMAAMPANAQFEVYVGTSSGPNTNSFVVTCSSTNIVSNWCYLPQSLGEDGLGANMNLLVTQVWNPGGRGGTYNNHAIGVWFDRSVGKWAVYNEDMSPMPAGASFNVAFSPGQLTPG